MFAGTKPTGADPLDMTTYKGCKDHPTDPLQAKLNSPEALAYDAKNGKVYFWGSANNCLRMVHNKAVTTLNGICGSCPYIYQDGKLKTAGFSGPEDMFVDKAGLIYVADTANHAIRLINP